MLDPRLQLAAPLALLIGACAQAPPPPAPPEIDEASFVPVPSEPSPVVEERLGQVYFIAIADLEARELEDHCAQFTPNCAVEQLYPRVFRLSEVPVDALLGASSYGVFAEEFVDAEVLRAGELEYLEGRARLYMEDRHAIEAFVLHYAKYGCELLQTEVHQLGASFVVGFDATTIDTQAFVELVNATGHWGDIADLDHVLTIPLSAMVPESEDPGAPVLRVHAGGTHIDFGAPTD